MSITLSELLEQIPSDTEARVESCRKRCNTQLRNLIRQETGLVLNRHVATKKDAQDQESRAVPMVLVAGLPESLQDREFNDGFSLALGRHRRDLQFFKISSERTKRLLSDLQYFPRGREIVGNAMTNFVQIGDVVDKLLARLKEVNLAANLLSMHEDTLGAYVVRDRTYRRGWSTKHDVAKIELYWGVIGLAAIWLGLEPEPLTTVVMAHELGHAYTHLGADIDGNRWDTSAFARSTPDLKEGLAQYYTALLCRRVRATIPDAYAAYEKLLECQEDGYRAHIPWLEEHRPEEVRLALLEERRSGKGQMAYFEKLLRDARSRLRGDESTSPG